MMKWMKRKNKAIGHNRNNNNMTQSASHLRSPYSISHILPTPTAHLFFLVFEWAHGHSTRIQDKTEEITHASSHTQNNIHTTKGLGFFCARRRHTWICLISRSTQRWRVISFFEGDERKHRFYFQRFTWRHWLCITWKLKKYDTCSVRKCDIQDHKVRNETLAWRILCPHPEWLLASGSFKKCVTRHFGGRAWSIFISFEVKNSIGSWKNPSDC